LHKPLSSKLLTYQTRKNTSTLFVDITRAPKSIHYIIFIFANANNGRESILDNNINMISVEKQEENVTLLNGSVVVYNVFDF
jgi:ABC-type phosphate transport system substrate-binding protein